MAFRKLFFIPLVLSLFGGGLRAQWKSVGAVKWDNPPNGGVMGPGAIHFKDGIIWAGQETIIYSTDTGKTWTDLPRPIPFDYFHDFTIFDFSFINKDTGIISYRNGGPPYINDQSSFDGIFQTTDRGQNWKRIYSFYDDPSYHLSYNHSSSIIHVMDDVLSDITTSLDGGKSWNSVTLGGRIADFAVAKDGTLYAMASKNHGDLALNVYVSTDVGKIWQQSGGGISADSYSIDVDSCDDSRLYIVDEDYMARVQGYSILYMSSDRGSTWTSQFTLPWPGLAGSFASSSHAQFVPTTDAGILRSTDHGVTWKNIGGPDLKFPSVDSRDICVINDNIVFLIDYAGNIWATFNSGGDSIAAPSHGLLVSPNSLFDSDTAQCGVGVSGSIAIQSSDCAVPSITSQIISGPDATNYAISSITGGGADVIFTPTHSGLHEAVLILSFSDGSIDTILLGGNGAAGSILNIVTSDQKTDTIGATISVPISISGLVQSEDVDIVLHYPTYFDYLATFDGTGAKVDLSSEQWPGRSRCLIKNVVPGSTAAWARFNVFADSSVKTQVTFDSVEITTATSPCEYLLPPATSAIITPPSGCGVPSLSQLLQGKFPTFSVLPNPTSGMVSIESQENEGEISIEVYDALGIERMKTLLTLTAQDPSQITLPESKGIYYLRIRTADGLYSSHLLLKQ